MWDLIVSVPDHCLSFYFKYGIVVSVTVCGVRHGNCCSGIILFILIGSS